MKKILLTSFAAMLAVGTANAALLPTGGVVSSGTFNDKIGDEQTLTTTAKVVVPAINELAGIVSTIQTNLSGVEMTVNKTGDIAGSITGGTSATDYTTADAVANYVTNALDSITTDIDGKQDKAAGMTSGNVALWGATGSTAGQVAITGTAGGIVTGNTGLTTGGAVADYIASQDFLTTADVPEYVGGDNVTIVPGTGANEGKMVVDTTKEGMPDCADNQMPLKASGVWTCVTLY